MSMKNTNHLQTAHKKTAVISVFKNKNGRVTVALFCLKKLPAPKDY